MDRLKIETFFMKRLLGHFINKSLEKKLGFNPEIHLMNLEITHSSLTAIDISIEMTGSNFDKLMEVLTDEQ